MKTKSRILSTIAAVAMLFTVALGVTSAQQPGGRGPGMGPGRGGPGGFGGPGGPVPVLRQLNLTDAQREQIKALTDEQRSQDSQGAMKKLGDLQRQLQAAIYADTPDPNQIDQIRAAVGEAESAALAARVELELKIAQILTPEQRKQARDLSEKRPGRGGARGQ